MSTSVYAQEEYPQFQGSLNDPGVGVERGWVRYLLSLCMSFLLPFLEALLWAQVCWASQQFWLQG